MNKLWIHQTINTPRQRKFYHFYFVYDFFTQALSSPLTFLFSSLVEMSLLLRPILLFILQGFFLVLTDLGHFCNLPFKTAACYNLSSDSYKKEVFEEKSCLYSFLAQNSVSFFKICWKQTKHTEGCGALNVSRLGSKDLSFWLSSLSELSWGELSACPLMWKKMENVEHIFNSLVQKDGQNPTYE